MVNYLLNENETRFKPNLSDGGLTFQTSAEKLYGGQFTLSTQLIKPNKLEKNRFSKAFIPVYKMFREMRGP